jgi:hypothetical protein
MSTNLAVGIAIGSSMHASSSSAAREAKTIACKTFVGDYNASTATVQEAKQYASCVDFLYPSPVQELFWVKMIMLSFLLFAVCGGIWGRIVENDTSLGVISGICIWTVSAVVLVIGGFILFA